LNKINNFKIIKKLLNFIDFNKVKINFLISGKESYSTALGVTITLVNLILFCLVLISFGTDFFYRINPNTVQQTIFQPHYINYTVTRKNFTWGYGLSDTFGNLIVRDDLVYVDVNYFNEEYNADGSQNYLNGTDSYLELLPCEQENFANPDAFNPN
jgi:hypothetical protein